MASAEAELARAQAADLAARSRLAATWGGASDEVTAVSGSLRLPESLPGADTFLAKLGAHPRLELQQSMLAVRRAALELERAEATPDISIGGGLRFRRDGSDAGFVAGASMPLPTRNRNQGNIRAARENVTAADQQLRAVEVELRAAFASAWSEVVAAHSAARALRHSALPPAEEAHAIARRALAAGELPLGEALEAQRALLHLQREVAEAEATFAIAHARAEALVDVMLPATAAMLSLP
jgi:cobalt-zinc-cadmium efflux system outer membrane protein